LSIQLITITQKTVIDCNRLRLPHVCMVYRQPGKIAFRWDHSHFFILTCRWLGGKSMRRKIDPRKSQNYQWSTVV